MKPLGMDAMLRVIHPTPAQDAIWSAVEAAIEEGLTPQQFRQEAATA